MSQDDVTYQFLDIELFSTNVCESFVEVVMICWDMSRYWNTVHTLCQHTQCIFCTSSAPLPVIVTHSSSNLTFDLLMLAITLFHSVIQVFGAAA